LAVIEPGLINRSARCQAVTGCYWPSYPISKSNVWNCKSHVYVCLLNWFHVSQQQTRDNAAVTLAQSFPPSLPPLLHTHSPITDATKSQHLTA